MARIIDESKLKRIKNATVQLIVDKGLAGASVGKIAKKANVAEGYLYRYYNSKNELICDLLDESINGIITQLENIIESNNSITDILEESIRIIFQFSQDDQPRMKFIYVLMNDYNFLIDHNLQDRTLNVCRKVIDQGRKEKFISQLITEEDVYLLCISYTIQFINHRIKNFFGVSRIDEDAIQKVIRVCQSAIINNGNN